MTKPHMAVAIREFEDGNARCAAGDVTGGIRHYQLAVAADPEFAPAHVTLGAALQALGRLSDARKSFERGLALDPKRAEAHYGLGNVELGVGHLDAAVDAYQRALELRPEFPEALLHLGVALGRRRQFDLAAGALRIAVSLRPDLAEAHGNLGSALRSLGDFDAAERSFRAALSKKPDLADVQTNLGLLLFDQGRIGEAIALYERVMAVNPDYLPAWRNCIAAILYDLQRDENRHQDLLRRFEARFVSPVQASVVRDGSRNPERRLRIGYVSSDLVDHPIARNLGPVLAHRDRRRFDVICYAEVVRPDAVTEYLRGTVNEWRPISGRSDEEVAALIADDRVDILVFLAGRLDKGRPLLPAYRAAPVQVSFHDPGTSGLRVMDYLIADPVLVPRGTAERFSERVVRLPSFYVHAPLEAALGVGALPALTAGHVTFGSFNNPAKVNAAVLGLWGEVLRAVPGSRLKLKFKNWFANAGLRARVLAGLGAAADRVEFVTEEATRDGHLALYGGVDIALDPFPFTGSTTTFEALWMGVPVVTLLGANMAGRWSASMLQALKLGELVARSRDAYVALAVGLAQDLPRLSALRAGLRSRVAGSPLCDGAGRARQVERLYRSMWRRWCRERGE